MIKNNIIEGEIDSMYYKYQMVSNIMESVDAMEAYCFKIILKANMSFIIGGCYFYIKKEYDCSFGISDILVIDCYQQHRNKDEAIRKIQHALEFFIFLTAAPYDTKGVVTESIENSLPIIDIDLSRKKMLQIQSVEDMYQRIRGKRELLENSLHLFSIATKMNYLFDQQNCEDAFFIYFKIIERIVNDDYLIEQNSIDKGSSQIQQCVTAVLKKSYGIQSTYDKQNEICNKIENILFKSVFEGIYHRILWFAQKSGIKIDHIKLSEIVKIRNKIAHGKSIDFGQYDEEYKYTIDLSYRVICSKFFINKSPKIEMKVSERVPCSAS